MTRDRRPRSLTDEEKHLLCSLADPLAPAPAAEKFNGIDSGIDIDTLFNAICHHGIEPVALRKLKTIETVANSGFADYIHEAGNRQFIANAMTMVLENIGRELFEQIATAKARAQIVKGPVFATQLYPRPSDRPFTDIDVLMPADELSKIGRLLEDMGYRQAKREFWDKSQANMEQKWIRDDNANILIELHTNLVHYPNLRRRISFGYEQYVLASQANKYPAAANFMVAVIHAAAGHKFHKLQLLVDVLQAFRKLDGDDIQSITTTLKKIPAHLEVLVCLDLIHRLFGQKRTGELSDHIARKSRFSGLGKLVGADQVLDTYYDNYHRSRLRRHAFRFVQNWAPR